MARPLRLEYPGAVYHVMARGHERASVFRDERDRRRWLDLLGSIARDEGWIVHAYCLLGNHYHVLLETPRGRLSRGLRSLNGRYAQWFNWRHRRQGHLFESRFRAILIQKQAYLLELMRYVVLNPVRAGMVRSPREWPWSSYRATAGLARAPEWLETDWTLSQFGRGRSAARSAFRRFVSEGKGVPSPLENVASQIYLGDEGFLREAGRLLEGRSLGAEIPGRQRRPAEPSLEKVQRAVAEEWGIKTAELLRRRGGEEKIAAIFLARKLTGLSGRQVAEAFGVKGARVSNVLREIDSGRRPVLTERIERLRKKLLGA